MEKEPLDSLTKKTIEDFGEQWTHYTDNEGFYGSVELLRDILGPLIPSDSLQGARVAEIGSGTGRIVNALAHSGAAFILAVEPSQAVNALRENTAEFSNRVQIQQTTGEKISPALNLDLIFSIGVLHHIPDPAPVVQAAFNALRPGGQFVCWLYGREGNRAYLLFVQPLRKLTTLLPHFVCSLMSHVLTVFLSFYIFLCRFFSLPLRKYMTNVIGKFSWKKRKLVIYDQLNPAYAKYYTEKEVIQLLDQAGFHEIRLYHRHGYSWTAVGTK